jgi:hypothetical protein
LPVIENLFWALDPDATNNAAKIMPNSAKNRSDLMFSPVLPLDSRKGGPRAAMSSWATGPT